MSHPCLFSIVPSSLVSTGYSTEKLQFHTNLKWITEDKYIMFNIHFHGYLFKGNKAIFSILTGYLYGPYGLYQSNCQNITDAINISVYKSQS